MNIRDYTLIARGIAASKPGALAYLRQPLLNERRMLVEALAVELAAHDPQFDHQWFLRACGVAE